MIFPFSLLDALSRMERPFQCPSIQRDNPKLSACFDMSNEVIPETLGCSMSTKEAISVIATCPVSAKKAISDFLNCPVMTSEVIPEILTCSVPPGETATELSTCPVLATDAILCFFPVLAKKADYELSVYSVSATEAILGTLVLAIISWLMVSPSLSLQTTDLELCRHASASQLCTPELCELAGIPITANQPVIQKSFSLLVFQLSASQLANQRSVSLPALQISVSQTVLQMWGLPWLLESSSAALVFCSTLGIFSPAS